VGFNVYTNNNNQSELESIPGSSVKIGVKVGTSGRCCWLARLFQVSRHLA